MHIPYSSLSPETLRSIIEEFVSREGTDYGDYDLTLNQKVEEVLNLIKSGKATIVFDFETESCSVVPLEGPLAQVASTLAPSEVGETDFNDPW